jgi:multidrug efflux pump subunit AcrB
MWGFRDKQLQVLVDPERLRANGLTLQQIIETTANAQFVCPLTFEECSTPGTGGLIETSNQRVGVQHIPVTASAEDLAQVPVEGAEGLALGDVADVVEDHQVLIGDAVGPDLLLVIEKFPDANTLEVTEGVEEAFEDLQPGMTGIQVDTGMYRPATYIETAQSNLLTTIAIGAAFALLALVLLLFEWRSVLVGAVTILVSLATAALVLSLTEATRNSMVVAGLVLALVAVVDDAVGDVANLARRLRERREAGEEVSTPRIALEAAHEMRSAAAYAMFIAVVSVVPVLFTQGAFGAFAPSAVWSYAVAVVASMVVAVIVTPALGLLLLPGASPERRTSPVMGWLRAMYENVLKRSVGSPPAPISMRGSGPRDCETPIRSGWSSSSLRNVLPAGK